MPSQIVTTFGSYATAPRRIVACATVLPLPEQRHARQDPPEELLEVIDGRGHHPLRARRARSVGRSQSRLPACVKDVPAMCFAVVSTADRQSPFAIAAVPTLNHGRTTSSIVCAPAPGALMRSPFGTPTLSSETGEE